MHVITIRPLEVHHLPRCAEVLTLAMRHAFTWASIEEQDVTSFRESTSGERVWVALSADRVVGLASLYEPAAFLHHLYVDPASHGQGVGSALLSAILTRTGGALSLKCQIKNEHARRFYARRGLVEADAPGGVDELGEWISIRALAAATPACSEPSPR